MHLDVELKKGDIIRIKDQIIVAIHRDVRLVVEDNHKLRLTGERQYCGLNNTPMWWCCPLNHPELRIRVYEDNIAWVERH